MKPRVVSMSIAVSVVVVLCGLRAAAQPAFPRPEKGGWSWCSSASSIAIPR